MAAPSVAQKEEKVRVSGNVELRARIRGHAENDRNRASKQFTRGNVVIIFALSCLWPGDLHKCIHRTSCRALGKSIHRVSSRFKRVYLELIRSHALHALVIARNAWYRGCATSMRSATSRYRPTTIFSKNRNREFQNAASSQPMFRIGRSVSLLFLVSLFKKWYLKINSL